MAGFSNVRVMLMVLSITAFTTLAMAQDGRVGFRSPSNNIYCIFEEDVGEDDIRCDIMEITNRPPPRPRDCDLDWGESFAIGSKATSGVRICAGDTVKDDQVPMLPYGKTWQHRGFTCKSEQSGVTCINGKGHGFELSRNAQRVF